MKPETNRRLSRQISSHLIPHHSLLVIAPLFAEGAGECAANALESDTGYFKHRDRHPLPLAHDTHQ